MDKEQKKIIALVFKKGYTKFPEAKSKTELTDKIIVDKEFKGELSAKSLLNFFNYFFYDGVKQNPKSENITSLLNYINFDTFKQFKANQPNDNCLEDVPFTKIKEKEIVVEVKEEKKAEPEKKGKEKSEEEVVSKDSFNKLLITLFISLCIVAISVSGFYFFNQKGDNKIHINNINNVNNFKQITPTKDTQFFSEETGEPQIWYASYKNQLDFFNAEGNHPKTNEKLKPVNREIVKTYFVEKLPINSTEVDYPKRINSFGIFNKGKKDSEITIYFDENYNKKTIPFNFGGTVTYNFTESSISKKLVVCEIVLTYIVISKKTNEKIDSNNVVAKGSGFTKQEAKQNAILNIEL